MMAPNYEPGIEEAPETPAELAAQLRALADKVEALKP